MTTRTLYVAEPRALWLARPPVVADCSVLAALLFAEPQAEDAATLLQQRAVHAPNLLPYELASVARKKQRAGATPVEIDTALTDFTEQRNRAASGAAGRRHRTGGAVRPERLRRRLPVAGRRLARAAAHI